LFRKKIKSHTQTAAEVCDRQQGYRLKAYNFSPFVPKENKIPHSNRCRGLRPPAGYHLQTFNFSPFIPKNKKRKLYT
jgi:hypothetical protein